MKKILALAVLSLFFSLFGAAKSHANGAKPVSLYTVDAVQVDIEASSAVSARDQAIEKAQKEAFLRLAKRLLPDSENKTIEIPSSETIQNMIDGFQIKNEKISSTRYIGEMVFRFNPNAVSNYFDLNDTPHIQTKSKPVLIVPFYQVGDRNLLWEEENTWRKAWEKYTQADTVLPVVLPLGDLNDLQDIPDLSVLSGDNEKLAKITSRYGTNDVLAVVLMKGNNFKTGEEIFQIFVMGVTDQGVIEPINIISPISPNDTVEDSMTKAVKEVLKVIEDDWKQKMAVRPTQTDNVLYAYIPFKNLQQWVLISSRLRSVPRIKDIEVEGLVQDKADVKVTYTGPIETLAQDLSSEEMILSMPEESDRSGTLRYQIQYR